MIPRIQDQPEIRPPPQPPSVAARAARVVLACSLFFVQVAIAATTPEETNAYEVALRFFQGAAYDLAEKELGSFLEAYPASEKVPEAVLLLAQARYQQKQTAGALQLLREKLPGAGAFEDQYRYWIGECLFQQGNFPDAATEFSAVVTRFPQSTRRLDAAVGEAYAQFRLGNAARTVELLGQPDGVFRQAGQARSGDELVVRGWLLLGEAALVSRQYGVGEEALTALDPKGLRPELAWQRLHLLARLQAAAQRWDAAQQSLSALVQQLGGHTNALANGYRADATALLGDTLERRSDVEGAIKAYEENLAAGVPQERRAEAASSLARLALEPGRGDGTVPWLESLVGRLAADPTVDPLRLSLSDLLLRRYFATPEGGRTAATAYLQQARGHVGPVTTNAQPAIAGRAFYNLGWCAWEEGRPANNAALLTNALEHFEVAVRRLPRSVEQAIAHFKAGDGCHALGRFPEALTNYWFAATNYVELPAFTNGTFVLTNSWLASATADRPGARAGLADNALYQVVRTAVAMNNLDAAAPAVALLGERYADSLFADHATLLYSEALGRSGRSADARALLEGFPQRFPNSPLRPDAELMIARTWQQEAAWPTALAQYENWLNQHTNHPSRGTAEFERAWTTFRSGDETNAFTRYTNSLAAFPVHPLAPGAQLWVADFFYRREQFDLAELEYQKLFQNTNWPVSELTYRARLMAAQSAYDRRVYKEAKAYLITLINTNCPQNLLPDAYYLLGNSIRSSAEATNLVQTLGEAIEAYRRIPLHYTNSARVPDAWLEIANCRFQLGKQLGTAEPKEYDLAAAAYTNAIAAAGSDVAVRSQAEVGLGLVLERKAERATGAERGALLADALARYLNVTEGKNLREGEVADLLWVTNAADNGARLAEELQRWEVAERLYLRLQDLVPVFKRKYEARLERLRQARAEAEGKRP